MRCSACGAEGAPGARFCASCGAAFAAVLIPAPPGPVLAPALVVRRGVFCPHCQQRTAPLTYFSRGVNIAKLAVIFAFTPFVPLVGPLIFFLIRKDRLICTYCKELLPGEASVPLLEAFSSAPQAGGAALAPMSPESALAAEAAGHQIARLERRGRRNRGRAWFFGIVTGLVAMGGVAAGGGSVEALLPVLSTGGFLGLATAFFARRGQRQTQAAAAERQRQRVLQVVSLARASGGRLNVTTVSSHLGLDFREAEALLDGMVDGRRGDVHVDDQGRMSYVFPELEA